MFHLKIVSTDLLYQILVIVLLVIIYIIEEGVMVICEEKIKSLISIHECISLKMYFSKMFGGIFFIQGKGVKI